MAYSIAALPRAVALGPLRSVRSVGAVVTRLLSAQRQRQKLRDLPDHLLDDIGLTRREALEEAAKPVWDVPGFWRR